MSTLADKLNRRADKKRNACRIKIAEFYKDAKPYTEEELKNSNSAAKWQGEPLAKTLANIARIIKPKPMSTPQNHTIKITIKTRKGQVETFHLLEQLKSGACGLRSIASCLRERLKRAKLEKE